LRTIICDVQHFCPSKCVYCYSDSGPSRPQATADQLWRVARAIARERPDAVMFSGGEPALAHEIDEVAGFLKASGIALSLFTSGWGLDHGALRRLCAAFDRIHVSLDAASPELNDQIRGKSGAHRHATMALRLLGELRAECPALRFGIDSIILRRNLKGVRELCALAAAIPGLCFLNIAAAVPSGRGSDAAFAHAELLDEAEIAWLLGQAGALRELLPPAIHLGVSRNDFLKTEDDSCVQLDPGGGVRAIKICDIMVGSLVDEPLDVLLQRAARWRADSALARSLTAAPDFIAWASIVRRLNRNA